MIRTTTNANWNLVTGNFLIACHFIKRLSLIHTLFPINYFPKMKVLLYPALSLVVLANIAIASTIQKNGETYQDIPIEGPPENCPLPDPLERAAEWPLQFAFNPVMEILAGATTKGLVVNGLSSLHYKLGVYISQLRADFEVTIGHLDSECTYDASGYFDLRPLPAETVMAGNFSGAGKSKMNIDNLSIKGSARLSMANKQVRIAALSFSEVKFDKFDLDLENYKIGGQTVDWAKYNANNEANFDRDWPVHGQAVANKVKDAINLIIEDLTTEQVVQALEARQAEDLCPGLNTTPEGDNSGSSSIYGGLAFFMTMLAMLVMQMH